MTDFEYRDRRLFCEETSLEEIAKMTGTPCYVYSNRTILDRFDAYNLAFGDIPHTVCYAVKANSNLALLNLLANAGAGFDIVSGGELYRVLKAGGDPRKVVFSGVGKTSDEIDFALSHNIFSFNCESEPELELIDSIAGERGVKARVAMRVNPDVDAATHPYISTGLREHKFGIDIAEVEDVYRRGMALANVALESVSCHIGSQLLDTQPLLEALRKMLGLIDRLRAAGAPISHIDLGGGVGVPYRSSEQRPDIDAFVQDLRGLLAGKRLHAMVEPGRSIVGEAGVLLTRVLYRKRNGDKEFVIVDAAMNDLIRPALYQSHHEIAPVALSDGETIRADVVGPVCETGDFLARDREMPDLRGGDLLAIMTAGAYGFAQASNYNSRPRPAEVLVDGKGWRIVRRRESYDDLIQPEVGARAEIVQ
ncbi:MAG: diaminopimelate decarboxylase [Acidobacteria bacterium]|nr:diaminopimelate decarboxylase [Acidobacteriota bacterium]